MPAKRSDGQLTLFGDDDAARLRRSRSRLFFALWPDTGLRDRLAGAVALIPPGAGSTYRIKPERYHLTLAFLGEVDSRQLTAALSAGSAVSASSFQLTLDRVGHFGGANVVWIGPGTTPLGLAKLKAALDRELLHRRLPIAAEPFVPHVTCLRRAPDLPDAPEQLLDWFVRDFVLVRSARDADGRPAGYKILKRWPLLQIL